MNDELKFNHVVDVIKANRSPEKQSKAIKPFACVTKADALRSGKITNAVVFQEKAATRPSDPNSMMDLGVCVYALPVYQNIDDIDEKFTESIFSKQLRSEKDDDMNNNDNVDIEGNENDDKKVEFKDDLETKSNKSKKSILSSRLSEKKKADMVKILIKRSGSISSSLKDGKVREANKELIKKMEDKL